MMRSIAEQTDHELGGRLSVLTRQKRDHVELQELLEDLDGTTGAAQGQVPLRIYRLLFPHASAEESVLWPVMRQVLPDGHELTLEVEREHQEVNELVTRLETTEAGDPERDPVPERLAEVLREDVRDEEDVLLPRPQSILSPARLRALSAAREAVRRTAPTRVHPVLARRPSGNVVAALPLSVLDRLRDLVDGTALRGPERAAPAQHRPRWPGSPDRAPVDDAPGESSFHSPARFLTIRSHTEEFATTSIADQTVEELGGPSSVLGRMRRELGEQGTLLQRLEAASGDAQDEVLTRLWRQVVTHAYAEETVVWPALRAVSADGEELTLHIEQGHQKLSELTAELDRTRPGQPGREGLITELVAELRLDIREERDVLLPRLREGADDRRWRGLGLAWTAVRHTAPTRPYVAVSRRPPGHVIAALPLSVLDRSRDGLDRAAPASTGGVRAVAGTTTRALAAVAAAIERSRPVRAGERARTRPVRWAVHRWLARNTPPTRGRPG